MSISHSTTPRLHTSTFSLTAREFVASSGAMYGRVPLWQAAVSHRGDNFIHVWTLPIFPIHPQYRLGLVSPSELCMAELSVVMREQKDGNTAA